MLNVEGVVIEVDVAYAVGHVARFFWGEEGGAAGEDGAYVG